MIISFENLKKELFEILDLYGFMQEKAETISTVIAESTLDGVFSHGINRFSQLIKLAEKGVIKKDANLILNGKFGIVEQWDGCSGPGITNARYCMERAINLAGESGVGFVALSNTNHWLRGGAYGWQAANAGMLGVCFTNTKPNMPPWGGKDSRIGNNPLIIAVPRDDGHIILDMAMSQFSFGKIHQYMLNGEKLPFAGGFDENGNITDEPSEILKDEKGLPIGYWKGSGLSIMLDLMVSLLAGGNNSYRIGNKKEETGLSQIFLCWDLKKFGDSEFQDKIINEILISVHSSSPIKQGEATYYPGEKTLMIRKKQLENGIVVNDEIWDEVINLKTS